MILFLVCFIFLISLIVFFFTVLRILFENGRFRGAGVSVLPSHYWHFGDFFEISFLICFKDNFFRFLWWYFLTVLRILFEIGGCQGMHECQYYPPTTDTPNAPRNSAKAKKGKHVFRFHFPGQIQLLPELIPFFYILQFAVSLFAKTLHLVLKIKWVHLCR